MWYWPMAFACFAFLTAFGMFVGLPIVKIFGLEEALAIIQSENKLLVLIFPYFGMCFGLLGGLMIILEGKPTNTMHISMLGAVLVSLIAGLKPLYIVGFLYAGALFSSYCIGYSLAYVLIKAAQRHVHKHPNNGYAH